jgi:hypothetical protein
VHLWLLSYIVPVWSLDVRYKYATDVALNSVFHNLRVFVESESHSELEEVQTELGHLSCAKNRGGLQLLATGIGIRGMKIYTGCRTHTEATYYNKLTTTTQFSILKSLLIFKLFNASDNSRPLVYHCLKKQVKSDLPDISDALDISYLGG